MDVQRPLPPINYQDRHNNWRTYLGATSPDSNWRQVQKSNARYTGKQAQAESLESMQNFSHFLFLNSALARAIGQQFRLGVIGTGIHLTSEVKKKNPVRGSRAANGDNIYKLDKPINKQIEEDFKRWGRAVTVDGQLSFYESMRKVLTTVIESGEAFILFHDVEARNPMLGRQLFGQKNKPVVFSYSILEGDFCDSMYHSGDSGGGDFWEMGIKYNRWGMPLKYAFKVEVNGLYQTREYDAQNVLHLFMRDTQRPGTKRGYPWILPVRHMVDMSEAYMKVQLKHAEQAASVNTYMTMPLDTDQPQGFDETDYADLIEAGNTGGGTRLLPSGTIVTEKQQIPASQLEPFIRAAEQQIAIAAGITYEGLTGDYSQSNFSSARLSNIVNSERFGELQTFIINKFLEIVYERWLKAYLLTQPFKRNIPTDLSFYNHSWSTRVWPPVEVDKAMKAALAKIEAGIASKSSIARDFGYDFETEVMQRKRDEELEKEYQLPQPTVKSENLAVINPTNPSQAASPDSSINPTSAIAGNNQNSNAEATQEND